MLSNPLKKGLQEAIHKFREYHFAKYKGRGKAVTMKDVLRLVHPKPRNEEESALFKKIIEGTLTPPKTWEVFISTNGASKKNWEIIMSKMGIMAQLRNLRNFAKYGCNVDSVIRNLNNETTILKSKQFPFRFFSAYKALAQGMREIPAKYHPLTQHLMDAVQDAMAISVKNLPVIPGITFMTADNSSSMGGLLSERGSVSYSDVANLLQAIAYRISDQAVTSVFGQEFAIVPVSQRSTIIDNMLKFKNTDVGHSTNAYLAFEWLLNNKIKVDRILLFSDMQCYRDSGYSTDTVASLLREYRASISPGCRFYSFDLTGYGTLKTPEKETYLVAGWSEKVLNFIELNETKGVSAVKKVEAYEPFKKKTQRKKTTSKSKTTQKVR